MTRWSEWGDDVPNNLGFEGVPEPLDANQRAQDILFMIHAKIVADLPKLEITMEMYKSFQHDPDFIAIAGLAVASETSYFVAERTYYEQKKLQRDNAAKARIDNLNARIRQMMWSR